MLLCYEKDKKHTGTTQKQALFYVWLRLLPTPTQFGGWNADLLVSAVFAGSL